MTTVKKTLPLPMLQRIVRGALVAVMKFAALDLGSTTGDRCWCCGVCRDELDRRTRGNIVMEQPHFPVHDMNVN